MQESLRGLLLLTHLVHIQGGPKNGLFWELMVSLAMVFGRKACYMSQVAEFCPEQE